MDVKLSVTGLRELDRALGRADAEVRKEFRREVRDIAEDVASDARKRVPVRSDRARKSIRATFSGSSAYVKGGKKSVPYYGWLDFGSRTPRRGNPRSRGPWSGSGKGPQEGRFIYPAIRENEARIERGVLEAFDKAMRRVGLR